MRSGVWDQPGQDGETPSLLKIQKLASCVEHAWNPSYRGGWSRIAWTWEMKVAVSPDCATALQLGNRVRQHLKKQKKQNKTKTQHQNNSTVYKQIIPLKMGKRYWKSLGLCPCPNLMLNSNPQCWRCLVGGDWTMGTDFPLAVLMIVSSHKIWLFKSM